MSPEVIREFGGGAEPQTSLTHMLLSLLTRDAQGTAGRVVLLGDPGSGKTMLTRYLTVWAAGGFDLEGIDRPPELVPLRIPFREYLAEVDHGKSTGIIDFLVGQAKDVLQVPRDAAFFKTLLDSGHALVLLDGLDEVARTDTRQRARDCVRAFAEAWPRSPMLVTSRIVGYDDAALPSVRTEGDARNPLPASACFSHLTLVPLTDEALDELIRRWYRAQIPADLGEEMDAAGPTRRRIVESAIVASGSWGNSAQHHLVASLTRLARFSTRHAQGVRDAVPEVLTAIDDVRAIPTALLAAIPQLVADAATALRVIDHLRVHTSEGEQLYFLWDATSETVRIWPEAAAEARSLQSRFFDHLEAPDRALFETVESKLDGRVPLWCSIPAGSFMMGSPDGRGHERERPQHRVTLAQPFQMATAPVTNRQYRSFDLKFSPQKWKGVSDSELLDHPAVNVSWHAAISFCRWLSARGDWAAGARLPTEAEWEYACRARTEPGLDYWSGNGYDNLKQVGWFSGNAERRTHRVAEKPRNDWSSPSEPPRGLYDVHGNVWEWTADWYSGDYYTKSPELDPPGPTGGEGRVVRGGSWCDTAGWARAACRLVRHPSVRVYYVGFRVVLPGIGSRS